MCDCVARLDRMDKAISNASGHYGAETDRYVRDLVDKQDALVAEHEAKCLGKG